ncbi:glycosyl transferase family 51 [Lactobacillus bombi]|nr:glycosyl transferase family 51 [Bombilactobacillus bombi]
MQNFQAHPIRKILKYIFLIFLLLIVILGIFICHKYLGEVQKDITDGYVISDDIRENNFHPKQPTTIKDGSNQTIKTLTHSQANYVSYSQINPRLRKGIIAVEDRRYYQHHGVDLTGVLRAIWQSLWHRQVQGGSTLTQQLVKNIVLKDQSQSFDRKIKEMVIAQQLEAKFSKKKILEFYLNNVYLGHGCYGIGSASQYYFSKDQNQLDIGEIALLVGIPNNQVLYDPVVHPTAAKNRRNTVLYSWYQQKLISAADFQRYSQPAIKLKIHNFTYDNDISQDYALNYAVDNAVKQLMMVHGFEMKYLFQNDQEKNDYRSRYSQIYDKYYGELLNGGFIIRTTINQDLQKQLVKIVDQQYAAYKQRDAEGKLEPQVASTIVDNRTGDVLAIIGGRTTQGDQLNRAINAYRQPGSTAKPLIAYAPAFERGYAPQSRVIDGPVGNIHNWYSGYRGAVSLRQALADSINTVAFKLALSDKEKSFYQLLGKMQFQGLYPADNNPILSVGGFTKGVTTTEMASAYSSFARGGKFVAPNNLKSIEDTVNERTLYQNPHTQVSVYTSSASYMMINAMQSVVTNGLGKEAALHNYAHVAGKTGTTDFNHDSYFVGMTPWFTIANWTGFDHQQPLSDDQLQLTIKTFRAEGEYLVDYLKEPNTDFKVPSSIRKVGDNLYVRQEAVQKSVAQIISENYLAFNSAEINANQKRLNNLDYRLIYHLTKKQEQNRERVVQQAITAYQQEPFAKLSQYDNKIAQLQKIRYKNENVKRMNAKAEFNRTIMELQRELNLTQAQLQAQKENNRLARFEAQKSQIEAEREAKRQATVERLMKQYQPLLDKVKEAYQNDDSNKTQLKAQLEDLINEIRSYGGNISDPVIEVN